MENGKNPKSQISNSKITTQKSQITNIFNVQQPQIISKNHLKPVQQQSNDH
jgi:hypothetical protein